MDGSEGGTVMVEASPECNVREEPVEGKDRTNEAEKAKKGVDAKTGELTTGFKEHESRLAS